MNEEYKCDLCTAIFYSENDIEQHWRKHLSLFEEDGINNDDTSNGNKGYTQRNSLTAPHCKICQHPFNDGSECEAHILENTVRMSHQCCDCLLYFESTEALACHKTKIQCEEFKANFDKQEVKFECGKCNVQFNSYKFVVLHQLQAECGVENSFRYICGKCEVAFQNFNEWLKHEEILFKQTPFYCAICLIEYRSIEVYLKHKSRNHISKKDENKYYCKPCDKKFKNALDRLNHEEESHMDMQPYKCFTCTYSVGSISNLRRHKLSVHPFGTNIPRSKRSGYKITNAQMRVTEEVPETIGNSKPFRCAICFAKYRSFRAYRDHIKRKHVYTNSGEIYECKPCNTIFETALDRLKHEEATHMDMRPFKCLVCKQSFENFYNLQRHSRSIHSRKINPPPRKGKCITKATKVSLIRKCTKDTKIIKNRFESVKKDGLCFICAAKFTSECKLKHHIAGHFEFVQCQFCNHVFQCNKTLSNHQPCHLSPFSCGQCGDLFSSAYFLNDHRQSCERSTYSIQRIKVKEWEFLCEICGCLKRDNDKLQKHYRQKHAERGSSFICQTCKSVHPSCKSLMVHRYWCHGDSKPFKCLKCNQGFTTETGVKIHLKTVHSIREDKFTCKRCDKKFATKKLLKTHFNVHMADTKPYKCELCDVRFSQRCNLNKHRIIHTGAMPYKCDVCPKAYNHRSCLRAHKFIHTGKFPFKCDICSQGFVQRRQLFDHKKRHEGLSKYTKFN